MLSVLKSWRLHRLFTLSVFLFLADFPKNRLVLRLDECGGFFLSEMLTPLLLLLLLLVDTLKAVVAPEIHKHNAKKLQLLAALSG